MLSTSLLGQYSIQGSSPSGPPSLASSGSQRAREYTAEEWEAQKETFTKLYQTPGLTLSKIQVIMREQHGFEATPRQYKRKVKLWNLERNIKTKDSQFMVHKEAKRQHEEGKKTKFIINGREVTEAKFARIRRKLFKNSSPSNPYVKTPSNIRYHTPRSPPAHHQPQRRPSLPATRNTHLVECFLCNTVTYGGEHVIMHSFRAHVRSAHPGYDILRFLDGQDASQVPGAVRTTQQLPSNNCGLVHGVRRTWSNEGDVFDPVRLGRLCLVEDQGGGVGKRPYLALTAAASCLTLRAEPRQEAYPEAAAPGIAFSPQNMHYPNEQLLEYGLSPLSLSEIYQTDFDNTYLADLPELPIPPAETGSLLDDWNWGDEEWKTMWKGSGIH